MTVISDKGEAARLAAEAHRLRRLALMNPDGGTWDGPTSRARVGEARDALLQLTWSLVVHSLLPGDGERLTEDALVDLGGVRLTGRELCDLLDALMYAVGQMAGRRERALDDLKVEKTQTIETTQ